MPPVAAPKQSDETGPEKDIHAILKDNYQRSRAVEKPLDLTKRKSKRTRDYALLMAIGNPIIALPYLFLNQSPIMAVFCGAGLVIYSTGITWAMLVVGSDY